MRLKKLLVTVMVLAMCFGVISDSGFAATNGEEEELWTDGISVDTNTDFSGGTGAQTSPYMISTAEDLAQLAVNVNNGATYNGKYFQMTNDIDLSGKYWIPVADGATSHLGAFGGHFDGNYNIISNMKIKATLCNTETPQFLGLFAWVYSGSLKNLGLKDAEMLIDNNRNDDSAMLLGYADNATVNKCFAEGDITAVNSNATIGGLVGQNYLNGYITNCYYIGNIKTDTGNEVGGLVCRQRATVQNCYVAAAINTTATDQYAIAQENSNCYYDSTLNSTVTGGQGTAKTTEEMKIVSMAVGLGSEWAQDDNVNGGYPYIAEFYPPAPTKAPTISGNSVYRSDGQTATVHFASDTSGTAYYKITEGAEAPSPDLSGWTNCGEVKANVTRAVSLADLTSGEKYVHIAVLNEIGLSNTLTISMPQDMYYYEDFEAYPLNTYAAQSGSPLSPLIHTGYAGASQENQKVTTEEESDNKVFTIQSSSSFACVKIPLPSNYRDNATTLILRADIMPIAQGTSYKEATHFGVGDRNAGVLFMEDTIRDAKKGITDNDGYSFNQWYDIEIVVNLITNKYTILVDGEVVASGLSYSDDDKKVNIFAGHGDAKAYYDNISYYTTNEKILNARVSGSDTEYNCAFTMSMIDEVKGTFLVALYDDNNIPVGVKAIEMDAASRLYNVTQTQITTVSEATRYKIMLWSELGSLQPLCNITEGYILAE